MLTDRWIAGPIRLNRPKALNSPARHGAADFRPRPFRGGSEVAAVLITGEATGACAQAAT